MLPVVILIVVKRSTYLVQVNGCHSSAILLPLPQHPSQVVFAHRRVVRRLPLLLI